MIRSHLTPHELVQFLNELVALDPVAMYFMVERRALCNELLANHPTVQVTSTQEQGPSVGLLGILNGLYGVFDDGPYKGWGCIGVRMKQGDPSEPIGFYINQNDTFMGAELDADHLGPVS